MNKITPYDKKEIYDKEIAPKIKELASLCIVNQIPVFISTCITNDEEKSTYKHELVAPDVQGLRLTDDMFIRFLNVTLGFDTVFKAPDTETAVPGMMPISPMSGDEED